MDSVYVLFTVVMAVAILTVGGMVLFVISEMKEDAKKSKIYKYLIKVTEGRRVEYNYTNEYEIKDGVVYFNNICANHFTIEELNN